MTPDSSGEEAEDREDWVKRGLADLYYNLQDIYHKCFVVKQMIKRVLRLLVFCLLHCLKLLNFRVISGRNQPLHIFANCLQLLWSVPSAIDWKLITDSIQHSFCDFLYLQCCML